MSTNAASSREPQEIDQDFQTDEIEREQSEPPLEEALTRARQRESETRWLLEASRAVLECHTFEEAARRIFDVACKATGAVSGYVALLNAEGTQNEVLFLESGGLPCEVDPDLPMPIRGLRAEAYANGDVAYDNDFAHSRWMAFIPPGHVEMRNVMFAPLSIEGEVVGVIGLANKPDDFTERDARIAEHFGNMTAIALRRVRIEDRLRERDSLLRATGAMAKVGGWEIEADTLKVRWTDQTRRIHGVSADYEPSIEKESSFFHPDDQETLMRAVERGLNTGESFDRELRFITAEGDRLWIRVIGRALVVDGEIRKLTGTFQDITERKHAENAVERYAVELEQSNRELARFADAISHDLREPARMVEVFLDLMRSECGGDLDGKAETYLAHAQEGATQMRAMIRALLDLARIDTQRRPLIPTEAEESLTYALRALASMIHEHGAVVTHNPLPTVTADAVQLSEVFQNLIANGIKFQEEGAVPRVHVSAHREDGAWHFSVRDNGIGIDRTQGDSVFAIFRRLHTESEYPGLGMGLPICKRIIERHHGRIWVESEPGAGSTFHFTIPV